MPRSALQKRTWFHLVLDGASRASAVASQRSSTVLTSSIRTHRIAALTPGLAFAGSFECNGLVATVIINKQRVVVARQIKTLDREAREDPRNRPTRCLAARPSFPW
jgi:hypothetical protein